jgi:hypothetical protein
MLPNDKIKLLSMADALLIEAKDRANENSAKDTTLVNNIGRNVNSIRALITKN